MANRRKSPVQEQYRKELRRIKRFIKSAEERGFRFEADIIPEEPKRITKASVKRLSKLTPTTLYKKATAVSELSGDIISGTERRKEERKESARRAQKTKEERRIEITPKNEPTFEQSRRTQDEQDAERMNKDAEFRARFFEGNIVYNEVMNMIDSVDKTHRKAAEHLSDVLRDEISEYGFERTMIVISYHVGAFKQNCEVVMRYSPTDPRHDTAIREIEQMIRGEYLTDEQLREVQEATDADFTYEG